jgi:hypothetical protein
VVGRRPRLRAGRRRGGRGEGNGEPFSHQQALT